MHGLRIRVTKTDSPEVRRYCVIDPVVVPERMSEGECPIKFTRFSRPQHDDARLTPEAAATIDALLERKSVKEVTAGEFEMHVTIHSMFNWGCARDGITNTIYEGLFSGMDQDAFDTVEDVPFSPEEILAEQDSDSRSLILMQEEKCRKALREGFTAAQGNGVYVDVGYLFDHSVWQRTFPTLLERLRQEWDVTVIDNPCHEYCPVDETGTKVRVEAYTGIKVIILIKAKESST